MKSQSSYVLECAKEIERLEEQSRIPAYNFVEELKGLRIQNGVKILDAGCGAGNVTKYLSQLAENCKVTGWDVSQARIETLKSRHKNDPHLSFEVKNLLEIKPEPEFDLIVCRYVFQHFNNSQVQKLLKNLVNALKPEGVIRVIDVEGLYSDIYPASPFLRKCLKKIRDSKNIDLQVGRKIPRLFLESGLNEVSCQVSAHSFSGADLAQEVKNIKQRFNNAYEFFKQRIGNDEELNRFRKEYIESVLTPGSVLFYNKFIVTGYLKKVAKLIPLRKGEVKK